MRLTGEGVTEAEPYPDKRASARLGRGSEARSTSEGIATTYTIFGAKRALDKRNPAG